MIRFLTETENIAGERQRQKGDSILEPLPRYMKKLAAARGWQHTQRCLLFVSSQNDLFVTCVCGPGGGGGVVVVHAVYIHVFVSVCRCVCIWKPEGNTGCLSR